MRFSISGLLGLLAVCAVTAVALANASIYWASLCFSLSILIVAIGFLGAICRRKEKRAYWIGFVIFGAGYLIAMYAPGFDGLIGHRLVTTKVLGYLEPTVRRTNDELKGVFNTSSVDSALSPIHEAILTTFGESHGSEMRLPQWGHFQQPGHALVAVLLGCFGGSVASHFYVTENPEP